MDSRMRWYFLVSFSFTEGNLTSPHQGVKRICGIRGTTRKAGLEAETVCLTARSAQALSSLEFSCLSHESGIVCAASGKGFRLLKWDGRGGEKRKNQKEERDPEQMSPGKPETAMAHNAKAFSTCWEAS
jgi:hypothetical protein